VTHQDKSAVRGLIMELLDPDGGSGGTAGRLDHGDAMRRLLEAALQDLVEAEASARIGAGRYERSPERVTRRNGARAKELDTPAGTVELRIPKVRDGSFFPSLLEPRRRVDQALWAVIATAWVQGVSTRRVDQLVKALGCESGISRSSVSRICAQIDEYVAEFLTRRLDDTWYPYLWLDATFVDARIGHRVVSQAVVVATACTGDGHREIIGMDVGDTESTDFWTGFLRSLRDRGLKTSTPADPAGVVLVISDAHAGLKHAVKAILPGAGWQRCRVHFARDITSKLGSAHSKPVNALISTIYAQTDPQAVTAQYAQVCQALTGSFPAIADMLQAAEPDLTAFAAYPMEHWQKIWSNNPIERLNREIKRRSDVVQIFPDKASITRLVGAILAEQNDEWTYAERRYLSEISMRRLWHTLHDDTTPRPILTPLPMAA